MVKRTQVSIICLRCGHGAPKSQTHNGHHGDGKLWWPREAGKLPAHCPVCNSQYWMKPKQTKIIGGVKVTILTEGNIVEIKQSMAVDQAKEACIGDEVIQYRGGTMTIYHGTGRAAIECGGDSAWGDYHNDLITLDDQDDDGNLIIYNRNGIQQID